MKDINLLPENYVKNQSSQAQVATTEHQNKCNQKLFREMKIKLYLFQMRCINQKGYLISNYHVVEMCQYVRTPINGDLYNIKVIASDVVNDLVVGQVENFSL